MELNRSRSDSLNPVSTVPETSLSVIGEGGRRLAIRNLSRLLSRIRGTSAKITQTFSRVLVKNTVLSLRLPMMRKVASLALRLPSESQPRVFFSCAHRELRNRSERELSAVASSPIWGWDNGPRPAARPPSISKHLRRTSTPSSAPTRAIVIRGLDNSPEECGNCLSIGPSCRSTMCQYSSTSMPMKWHSRWYPRRESRCALVARTRFAASLKPVSEERISTLLAWRRLLSGGSITFPFE